MQNFQQRIMRRVLGGAHLGWRWGAGLALAIFLVVLLGVPAVRELAPTRDGWRLFSMSRGGVVAQHPKFWLEGRAYGREDVYRALLYAARELQQRHPGSYVAYMDVSKRHGGQIARHLSHRTGRDVDILFFGRSELGLEPRAMSWNTVGYSLKYDCASRKNSKEWVFDEERGWAFLMALKNNPHVPVERIFVEPCVEDWLLAAGRAVSASASELRWAERFLRYAGPRSGDHLDHFHIRFQQRGPAEPRVGQARAREDGR
ncbi:MAG: penicillin-insensitive murein endopeptidase [Myxococcota bacterium]|nr:penicillin-insensitive murein endopeptidase [Myxococcota bacterium]